MSEHESGSRRGSADARSDRQRAPRPPDAETEADVEMEFHIQTRADAYVRDGLNPDEALARARSEFGDRERARAECVEIDGRRERRRWLAEQVNGMRRDLRYAVRRLRASPGFTTVAVLTLALGIGANSAIFSVVNGVLLRPLPFTEADRLAMVWLDNQRIGMRTDLTSWPMFEDWRAQNRSFASMAGFTQGGTTNLAGDFEPERVASSSVRPEFFHVLGVQPILGRVFNVDDTAEGAARVAIIGHRLWTQQFGGAADAVGRTIRLNGIDTEVIGVMPAGFDFPNDAVVWKPLGLSDYVRQVRGGFWLSVVGRLADGVSIERAQADMDVVAAAQAEAYPDVGAGRGIFVQPMLAHFVGDVRPALLVLLGAVGLVLLIACANVANLMLSRAAARQREMAVRLALGAGRGQLVRQLLTESMVLAIIGGVVGLTIAYGGVRLLRATAPADLPRLDGIALDPVVLGFTLALSLLTSVLFGLAPSLQSARGKLSSVLHDQGRGSVSSRAGWRTRGALIIAELALSSILLVGAGLLIQSFVRLSRTESGFEASGVLTARIALTGSAYAERDDMFGFYDRLFERLRALPGVQYVAAGTDVLMLELPLSGGISVEGKPREPNEERAEVTFDVVTPGYFTAVGTPLLSGRDFGPEDRADGPAVAIVNQAMVRRYWPDEEPIGKRFKMGGPDSESPWRTVVGVAGDARRTAPDREARPSAYLPHRQSWSPAMMLLIRSSDDPLQLAGPLREAVRELDPNQPLADLSTLDAMLAERLALRRLTALLASVFAGVAIVLALVGVYAVLSYAVAQSTREIGVRIALGAEVGDVLRMVFAKAGVMLAAGIALGLGGALIATRTLSSLLYEIDALDPLTFAVAPLLLGAVALMACYVPARRATRIDPAVALRAEG